jgi:hypothetical protein
MKPPHVLFTEMYFQWLESFRAMLPGFVPAGPSEEVIRRREQVAANQEWEDEGGSIKPAPTPEVKHAPKIPF